MASGTRKTDPAKWDKQWFRKLSPKHKAFWFFLCDKCDWAGVWEPDFDLAAFQIGEEVDHEDLQVYGERVQLLENNKYWLSGFIDFQQPKGLSEANRAHKSIFESIRKNGIPYLCPLEGSSKPLQSPKEGAAEGASKVQSSTVPSSTVQLSKVKEGGSGETEPATASEDWKIPDYVAAFRAIRPEFANVPEFGITSAFSGIPSRHWKPAFDAFAFDMLNTLNASQLPRVPVKLFAGYLNTCATGKRSQRNSGGGAGVAELSPEAMEALK